MELTPGQIYLADQRGITENDQAIRWSTFSYEGYQADGRQPFGALLTLNDELFMPAYRHQYQTGKNLWMVIIPITGEVVYEPLNGQTVTIDVGQVYTACLPAGSRFQLVNPYVDDRINFLYLEFKADEWTGISTPGHLFNFDFEGRQNQLVRITTSTENVLPFTLHMAQFAGRGEALFYPEYADNDFFAFVIAGAFELQGRLLHQRDGLALWDLHTADMEALSNNAVIMILDMKKQA